MEVSLYFWYEKGIGIDMGSQTSLKTSQRGWGGGGGGGGLQPLQPSPGSASDLASKSYGGYDMDLDRAKREALVYLHIIKAINFTTINWWPLKRNPQIPTYL